MIHHKKHRSPTGLMRLARAFTEAGWDDIETTVGGTIDAPAQPDGVFRNERVYHPGLAILDVVYFGMSSIMVTPNRRGLVHGDLLTVLSVTPYGRGFGGDELALRTYLVRVRCERDGGYYQLEIHKDAVLNVRRSLA